jgi:YVTN family beta-propeller protein
MVASETSWIDATQEFAEAAVNIHLMHHSGIYRGLAMLLAAGLFAACDGDGVDPSIPDRISVTPSSASVSLGQTQLFQAQVLDQRGDPFPGQVTWSTDRPGVASIDVTGLAEGLTPGEAVVAARFEALTGTASLAVVDEEPPTVTILSPGVEATLENTVDIQVEASDDHTLAWVAVLIDGEPLDTLRTPPYQLAWDTRQVENGLHQITAVAADPTGNQALSTAVLVFVDNDGWIRVELKANAGSPSSFQVTFDHSAPLVVSVGAPFTSSPLSPGTHFVELVESFATCGVDGQREKAVEVVGGDTTTVTFDIRCFVGRAYVSNNLDGDLSIIDSDNPGAVGVTHTIGGSPRCLAAGADGLKAYVVSLLSNFVSVINTTTDTQQSAVTILRPRCVASHTGRRVVLVSSLPTSNPSQLFVIDQTTDVQIAALTVADYPHRMAFNEDGSRAYVAHTAVPGRITVVDTEGWTTDAVFEVGPNPFGLLFDTTRDRLIVANTGSTTVDAIDAATGALIARAAVGVAPIGLAHSTTDDLIYVANSASNTVSILRGSDLTPIATIPVGENPREVAISGDGVFLLVTNWDSDDVSLIDLELRKEVLRIPVGRQPNGLLILR